MKKIKKVVASNKLFFKNIYARMVINTETAIYQIIPFSILASISFPIFYYVNNNMAASVYENLPARLIASALCLPLIFFHFWPKKLRIVLPVYWYLTLIYVLPFFFTFFFLMNGASQIWLTNIIIMILLLILLVDWLSFIAMIIIGCGLGFIFYYFSVDQIELPNYFYNQILIINVFAFISVLLSRSKSKIEAEKFSALQAFGYMIAHELRTPLNAIQSSFEGIKMYLPSLIAAYKKASNAQLEVEYIRKDQLVSLERSIDTVETEANLANMTINMLLTNVRQTQMKPSEISIFSAKDLIESVLKRYPTQADQRAIIHVDSNHDFMIQGDKELLSHLFFNLLKNALYFLEAAKKGEIMIWFDADNEYNYIHFKDTGQGIAPKDLPHIFERFYTKRYHGTGIGLAFCKTVMNLHKGKITCHSVLGEYAEFIMSFPKIKQENL
ncbi:MAG: HAMP domain-containing sensor histidine kinase [Gammaproteobacteria bacterium]|jgi:two-component system CAI-1 autoinducer sensor kinase/phosphatase CqsS